MPILFVTLCTAKERPLLLGSTAPLINGEAAKIPLDELVHSDTEMNMFIFTIVLLFSFFLKDPVWREIEEEKMPPKVLVQNLGRIKINSR